MTFKPNKGQTHQVHNQPTALIGHNAYQQDKILRHYVSAFYGRDDIALLNDYGQLVGQELLHAGFDANKYKPEFVSHDRFGRRIDEVSYHPSYHQLMSAAMKAGHHSLPFKDHTSYQNTDEQLGSHVIRAALTSLHTQADPGSGCPLTMTFAAVPAFQCSESLAKVWLPKVLANRYEPDNKPYFEKSSVTIGMAMTEKQGGSDVRANSTVAFPLKKGEIPYSDSKEQVALADVDEFELIGHKWFCSAPMCDAFLTLAYEDGHSQLSCFVVPRWRPDGTKNPMEIQRLKDKKGNISNASSEIEYRGAFAWRLGEQGKGVKTIIQMVGLTRFDCIVGSATLMHQATQQAVFHSKHRQAFGKTLIQQPLMQNVLADLALESEAAMAIAFHTASCLQSGNEAFVRVASAVGKYWVCKRAAAHTAEAMECVGGVGLIGDSVFARLYTESPVNAIWEGSGNVQCLDVLRILQKDTNGLSSFLDEVGQALGLNNSFDNYFKQIPELLTKTLDNHIFARRLVESMALAWQASVLLRFSGDTRLAELFINSRLTGGHSGMFGTLLFETSKPYEAEETLRSIINRYELVTL
ncbi:acyl-CoA dehydrogenase family protein [Psychrosphaera ytuae]|uniref:Acyl-CoA dehydrogenase family protein n=1 Tax=Psychrosphaera ytuae TaxID=2820710 RepID=A0A975HJ28_9GAMM|nr:acyl-CoA dehydrogenase family protein [Psychrosphaera ytuae]QTH64876.1 acyl-CoA dehydrogenase family protein [Psychrosphaera ytuae]